MAVKLYSNYSKLMSLTQRVMTESLPRVLCFLVMS